MTLTRQEKSIPRRWLMTVVAFDSTIILFHFFEMTNLIPSTIVFVSSSSIESSVNWENVLPHILPSWLLAMILIPSRSDDEIQTASQFILMKHSFCLRHRRGLSCCAILGCEFLVALISPQAWRISWIIESEFGVSSSKVSLHLDFQMKQHVNLPVLIFQHVSSSRRGHAAQPKFNRNWVLFIHVHS